MDIFNKNKVRELERKIEELESQIDKLESELEFYKNKEVERVSKKHKTGAWCTNCKNLVTHSGFSSFPYQFCILDNECKDRRV